MAAEAAERVSQAPAPGHRHRYATTPPAPDCAGDYAPPPLFSPAGISFGTVNYGNLLDLETPAIDPSMSTVASAVRNTHASALGSSITSVARSPSAARTGDTSSELPSLFNDSVDFSVLGTAPAPPENEDNRGWTPVTRKTSRSHREYSKLNRNKYSHNSVSDSSSESESTIAQATREMSRDDREALARRHEVYAA
ncbi:hypothetical protein B0H13DRAFT_2388198 [Mycena leptocephala]|nr:hypothetical protein B0H13DRAFT_2388198 [Mycena leptocephala]